MADNILDIAILSPLKFTLKDFVNPAPYNTKYMDDWQYPDTVSFTEVVRRFLRPWQKNDIINIQLLSNFSPFNLHLLDCNDNVIDSFEAVYKPSSIEGTGQKVYEFSIALNGYAEGIYYFRLDAGSPIIIVGTTALFDLRQFHEGTILFSVTHDQNDYDTVFETGIQINFRMYGGFLTENYVPAVERVIFVDQPENAVQLSSRTFDTDDLIIGTEDGVPPDVIKTINQLFACSEVLVDGKQWVGIDNAKFEGSIEPGYPLVGWRYKVRPADNETKKRFTADGDSNSPSSVVWPLDADGIGQITGTPSTNIIQITAINP